MTILAKLKALASRIYRVLRRNHSTSSVPTQESIMPDAPATVPATPATDAVLAKVKDVLATAGHDVALVWDEVVALAKKIA